MLLSTKLSFTVSESPLHSASSVCWLMVTPKSSYSKSTKTGNAPRRRWMSTAGKLEAKFYGLEFHHVPRDNNVAADALSKLGFK